MQIRTRGVKKVGKFFRPCSGKIFPLESRGQRMSFASGEELIFLFNVAG